MDSGRKAVQKKAAYTFLDRPKGGGGNGRAGSGNNVLVRRPGHI